MSEGRSPLFLERQGYRGRRLVDFLRILPLIGGLLWAVPLLWPSGPDSSVTTSEAIIYIFGVWFFMVLVSAVVSLFLRRSGLDLERKDG
ncbi:MULTISPECIES: hypothetical protein [Shimia]|uniref:hypothetical protein n=1 Tax=Shimia TaxID=573139 RepID=UPI001FB5225E|nr:MULTISPECIES: hypothetical protein [Shimia]MDV4145465.1 hypothetical protein [Shimia sp. FJ5]